MLAVVIKPAEGSSAPSHLRQLCPVQQFAVMSAASRDQAANQGTAMSCVKAALYKSMCGGRGIFNHSSDLV